MTLFFDDAPVIVAAGMEFEARIAKGPGARVHYGQNRLRYVVELDALARGRVRGIVSFGVAGGLSPALKPGDIVVASSVITAKQTYETHPRWVHSLKKALPDAVFGEPVFAAEDTVSTVFEKEALWKGTGAVAVDVESGIGAAAAERYGLPFAVLRVIIDPAHRTIPTSAAAGVREDGSTDALAVLRSLMKRPAEIREIARLAGDSRRANKSLLRCRKALGPFFSLLDPLELPLNVK
jgi:hopanoid-associated phosphorylase